MQLCAGELDQVVAVFFNEREELCEAVFVGRRVACHELEVSLFYRGGLRQPGEGPVGCSSLSHPNL